MGKRTLVEDRLDEGRRLLDLLCDGVLDVSVAFWLYTLDDDKWVLHIVSPTVDQIGLRDSYVALIQAMKEFPDADHTEDNVRLHATDNRLGKAFLRYAREHPSTEPALIYGTRLDGIIIDQAFIYPSTSAS